MKDKRVSEMSFIAMVGSIMAVITLIQLLMGIYLNIEVTFAPIIMVVSILYGSKEYGYKLGIKLGFIFGLSTFIFAWIPIFNLSPLSVLFRNPIVSILPRIAYGATIYPLYVGFDKFIGNFKHASKVNIALTALVSTVLHAVFVLPILYFFAVNFPPLEVAAAIDVVLEFFQNSFFVFFFGILLANTLLVEVPLTVLVGTPVAYRLLVYRDGEAENAI